MKKLLLLTISFFSLTVFAQKYSDMVGKKITLDEWNQEARTNIRLLPKYGYAVKNQDQKNSDKEFIVDMLQKDTTAQKACSHLIRLGFSYLYRDVKTAMYRFNQAFLLDSTNTDIYWGYGAVYFTLGDYANAEKQYVNGLAINPNNPHLLTDYGTYFFASYTDLEPTDKSVAAKNLNSAITYMTKSYKIDPSDQNTLYKLSICYFYKDDCKNALKFYNECKALGGQPIDKGYADALLKKCQTK